MKEFHSEGQRQRLIKRIFDRQRADESPNCLNFVELVRLLAARDLPADGFILFMA
jgi:hypothetical protein